MTIKMTYRRATPDEMKQISKDADEVERLYFENGLDADRSATAESQKRLEEQVVDSHLPLDRTRSTTSDSGG